jgi:hypothetical protein
MVSLNPKKWFKDPEKEAAQREIRANLQRELASNETHPAGNIQSPEELQKELAQSYHLQYDDMTLSQIDEDPQLRYLLPALSPLNRTSKIPNKRLAEMARLDMEYVLLLHQFSLNEADLDLHGWAKLESLRIFGLSSVNDQVDGYRGKLVTEKIKEVRVGVVEKKKEGLI